MADALLAALVLKVWFAVCDSSKDIPMGQVRVKQTLPWLRKAVHLLGYDRLRMISWTPHLRISKTMVEHMVKVRSGTDTSTWRNLEISPEALQLANADLP